MGVQPFMQSVGHSQALHMELLNGQCHLKPSTHSSTSMPTSPT